MKKILLSLLMVIIISGCVTPEQRTEYIHVGENWSALYNLPTGKDIKVEVTSPKSEYKIGEKISLEVVSDTDGRVWVITVGPDDKPAVVFPNEIETNNLITANVPFQIPSKNASWNIKAVEPVGKNLLLVLVTEKGMQVDELERIFTTETSEKALAIEKESPKWGSAKLVISVKE